MVDVKTGWSGIVERSVTFFFSSPTIFDLFAFLPDFFRHHDSLTSLLRSYLFFSLPLFHFSFGFTQRLHRKKKNHLFFFSPVFLFLLIHISTSFAALLHYIGNSLFLFILNFHHRNIRLFLLNKQQLQHDDPFMTPIVFSSSSKFALSFAHSPCFAFCLA